MIRKKFKEVKIGDAVMDMQGKRFRSLARDEFWVEEELEILSYVESDGPGWGDLIDSMVAHHTGKKYPKFSRMNEYLYIIGEDRLGRGIVVAYSYDGMRGGTATLGLTRKG